MIRFRQEQIESLREEMRDALAERLARRGATRYPEKTIGRELAELRADARRLATSARERGFVSEEDVTLFFDLSMELEPGFEQGPTGAWARQVLKERGRSPHERIVALREKVLLVEEWDPYRERVPRALTGRVSRIVTKGPPRRLDALRQRREVLSGLRSRLRHPPDGTPATDDASGREAVLRNADEAWRVVQNEYALRLELERTAGRAREKAAAHRAETDPAKRKTLEEEIGVLAIRYGRMLELLREELAEVAPRRGSADAEDPCVARIETDRVSEREAVRPVAERSLRVARDLCEASGSASEGDRVVVAIELSRMPGEALDRLRRGGTRVVVCRGSVVDAQGDLAGTRPRGWPPGSGWNEVPGCFDGSRNEVVLATRGHGPRGSGRVPERGEGHGSANLAIHVAHHGLDEKCGNPSGAAAFKASRAADQDRLPDYCRQPGTAGLDETWAESAARFFGAPKEMESDLPNLHRYWREGPGGRTDRARGGTVIKEEWEVRTTRMRRRSSIGSASLDEEGSIVLDLRATDGHGILGDARLVYSTSHPQYREILDHLGGLVPGETKPVPPWPAQR